MRIVDHENRKCIQLIPITEISQDQIPKLVNPKENSLHFHLTKLSSSQLLAEFMLSTLSLSALLSGRQGSVTDLNIQSPHTRAVPMIYLNI